MLQSFLVSLAMAILKYYATIAGKEIYDYIKEQEKLRKNSQNAGEYNNSIHKPGVNREGRHEAEDKVLS